MGIVSVDGCTGSVLFEETIKGAKFLQGRRQNLFVATDTTLSAWDTAQKHKFWEIKVVKAGTSSIQALRLAHDVDAICVGTTDSLHLFDTNNGSKRGEAKLKHGVGQLSYMPPRCDDGGKH